ncbi:MAG: PAS domain-containing protein, partial [Rhodoferax sp.]
MHKLLARQVKRVLGVSEEQLPALYEELGRLAQGGVLSPVAARVFGNLGNFLSRVDEAYQQNDRDLELKTISLELSSVELTQTNSRLREELVSRDRAIDSLRQTARGLLVSIDPEQSVSDDDNLETLSELMRDLVRQHEESQLDLRAALTDLAYQKFALDQHAIVSTTDVAGNIIYANDRFCEISGFTRAELLGQNHRMINSRTHDRAFFAQLWQTITSGQVWHGEVCNRSKMGSLYWVSATIVPLRDNAGKPSMFIAIRTDITERKKMAASMELAEARLRHIANTVPGVVFQAHVGPNGTRFTFVSERVREILGFSPEQLKADASLQYQLILEDERGWVESAVQDAARRQMVWRGEYRVAMADRSLRWIRSEMNPEPELSPLGDTVFTGIWQDVTALKEADARLREVTENIPVAVFQYFVDAQGVYHITFMSDSITAICGLYPDEIMQGTSRLVDQVHSEDKRLFSTALGAASDQSKAQLVDFRMVHRQTGHIVWVHGEAHPRQL